MPTLTESEARTRFATARVAHLATVGGNAPHLVPVVFALEANKITIAIDHKPKTTKNLRRLTNIRTNPAVSLLVDHYADDWSTLWWVRADGQATIVPEAPIEALIAKYEQYQKFPPAGPIIVVTITNWTNWSA